MHMNNNNAKNGKSAESRAKGDTSVVEKQVLPHTTPGRGVFFLIEL